MHAQFMQFGSLHPSTTGLTLLVRLPALQKKNF